MGITKIENESLYPGFISAFIIFIFIAFQMPGPGNIFTATVVALASFPMTTLFASYGIYILNKLPITNKVTHVVIATLLGALFGFIGNLMANFILQLQGIINAFIFSGAIIGFVVSLTATANKSSNLTGEKDSPSS